MTSNAPLTSGSIALAARLRVRSPANIQTHTTHNPTYLNVAKVPSIVYIRVPLARYVNEREYSTFSVFSMRVYGVSGRIFGMERSLYIYTERSELYIDFPWWETKGKDLD